MHTYNVLLHVTCSTIVHPCIIKIVPNFDNLKFLDFIQETTYNLKHAEIIRILNKHIYNRLIYLSFGIIIMNFVAVGEKYIAMKHDLLQNPVPNFHNCF